jgi:tetratricopeptide (TPR) repeat protein
MMNHGNSHAPHTLLSRDWEHANEDGISFGANASWDDAYACFLRALKFAPEYADAPLVHAVLLGNLAQSQFRLGDTEGAIQSARRALAARMISCDDDGDAPMARIRSDLAVYLAASGAHEEAEATLSVARASLEWRYGDEDIRLITVLENQARIALASGRPAAAEPALLRLHALLVDAGEDPARLNPLFAMVSASRGQSELANNAVETASEPTDELSDDWSDNLPDVLAADTTNVFPAILDDDAFDLIDDAPHEPMRSPSAHAIRMEGLIEPGLHSTPSAPAHTNPLGFEVQYGIPQELLLESSTPLDTNDRERD